MNLARSHNTSTTTKWRAPNDRHEKEKKKKQENENENTHIVWFCLAQNANNTEYTRIGVSVYDKIFPLHI